MGMVLVQVQVIGGVYEVFVGVSVVDVYQGMDQGWDWWLWNVDLESVLVIDVYGFEIIG